MSKISNIYDRIETIVEATLTDYRKIPNPYVAEENSETLLTKGYGISIGEGINTNRQICGKKSYSRSFVIPLINLVASTDHDVDRHAAIEKQVMEDHFSLWGAFELDSDLDGHAAKAITVSDGGLLFLEGERLKYLLMELIIGVEYFELL